MKQAMNRVERVTFKLTYYLLLLFRVTLSLIKTILAIINKNIDLKSENTK